MMTGKLKKLILTCLLTGLLLVGINVHAEVYRWVDEQGNVNFSDTPPARQQVSTVDIKVNTYTGVSYDASIFDTKNRVVIYTTSGCVYCKKAKNYFSKNNIAYTEYNIEKNVSARKEYRKMGATGVPVILVGRKRMNGFSEAGFERIYQSVN